MGIFSIPLKLNFNNYKDTFNNFYFASFHKSRRQQLKYFLVKKPDEDKLKTQISIFPEKKIFSK